MKKILMIGETNLVVENIYDYLSNMYKVQLCEPVINSVNRMAKIIKPAVVIVVKTSDMSDALFRNIRMYIRDIPILIICNSDEEIVNRYRGGSIQFLFKPINNDLLVNTIEKIADGKAAAEVPGAVDEDVVATVNEPLEESAEDETYAGLFEAKIKKKILAIDDNAMVLRGIKKLLDVDYEVTVVTSVEQAFKLVENKSYDLILLDYEMPEVSGYTALQVFKTNLKTREWPIVFLTGVSDKKRVSEVVAFKPEGYLLKPIDADMLKKTIKNILDK